MNFKVRKIRKNKPQKAKSFFNIQQLKIRQRQKVTPFKNPTQENNKLILPIVTILSSIVVVSIIFFSIFSLIKSIDLSSVVFSFGKALQTDEQGKTNFLLVGIGGEGHDGANLTDTIIVASINYEQNTASMLSIPRDFYIISNEYGNQRINSIYQTSSNKYGKNQGLDTLRKLASEITGIEIQYYALIDFHGFEKIVDILDGIEVLVKDPIYDTRYPKGETIYYETFKIDAGLQKLDGETALKYARSRSTTGDFNRAKRQQEILYAILDKALSLNILTNPTKITSIYNEISNSIDTNLSITEIIELAKLSKEIDKEGIMPAVLNDNPSSCGGILYTPAREYFDGASVLLPAGNGKYDYIHQIANNVFNHTKTISLKEEIQILNGTKTAGLAGVTMNMLLRNCLNIVYYGNASNRDLEYSTIYYKLNSEGEKPASLELIETLVPIPTKEGIPPEYTENQKRQNTVIVIELGKDYLAIKPEEPYNQLNFLTSPKTQTDQSTQSKTAQTENSENTEEQTAKSIESNENKILDETNKQSNEQTDEPTAKESIENSQISDQSDQNEQVNTSQTESLQQEN